jgi:hypothetical protein
VDDTFAFIIHPIQIKKDVSRKYPLLGKILTEGQINFFSRFFPPVYLSEIEGIRSESTGRELKGWFIACPFTPPTMLALPVETVYKKLVACGIKARSRFITTTSAGRSRSKTRTLPGISSESDAGGSGPRWRT